MYRSNPINIPPGHFTFLKIVVQILPYPSQNAVQMPHTRVHSGDQMPPLRGHFTGTWMTEGRKTCLQLSNKIFIYTVACEQALLFGQAKLASRERTSEGPILCHSWLRRSLTRSRETCFARPNRRACSQAINTANNSHQYNKLKTENHSVSVFTMSKTMSVPHGHCKFWCYDSKILFWISKSHLQLSLYFVF